MPTIDDSLSYEVIGFAMKAHRELGPGLDERFYHDLIARQLGEAGIAHQVKPRGRLVHRGQVADEFEADLIVAGRLGAELKVLWGSFAPEHLFYRNIPCIREPVVTVRTGTGILGESKLPGLVLPNEGALLVTALRESRQAADRAVLQTYVRHLGLRWGLHFNFGKTCLGFQCVC